MIKVVGVPEHFNMPWHLAIAEDAFKKAGVHLNWQDIPEGTGKMCQMLRAGEADVAVLLTEGIIKDIHLGNPSKIIQLYVESPLLWGVHVAAHAPFEQVENLENKTAAISRMGSGSHLMAMVMAEDLGWPPSELKFKVVNTLPGAVEALTRGEADYFLWERFTTQPLVDQHVFKRIGQFPTPWPCFVIAATNQIIAEERNHLVTMLEIVNRFTAAMTLHQTKAIAERYHLTENEVKQWLGLTRWSYQSPSKELITSVQNTLFNIGLIQKIDTFASLVTVL